MPNAFPEACTVYSEQRIVHTFDRSLFLSMYFAVLVMCSGRSFCETAIIDVININFKEINNFFIVLSRVF